MWLSKDYFYAFLAACDIEKQIQFMKLPIEELEIPSTTCDSLKKKRSKNYKRLYRKRY